MEKAKLIMQGQNQVLILPENFRFEGDEVIIKKQDNMVVLIDEKDQYEQSKKDEKDDKDAYERFLRGVNGFTDDFFENGREQN